MVYEFKKSLTFDKDNIDVKSLSPGEWGWNGKSVLFCCPTCKRLGDLVQHEIDSNGVVTPSVGHSYFAGDLEHPEEPPRERCGFHEMIQLTDWK